MQICGVGLLALANINSKKKTRYIHTCMHTYTHMHNTPFYYRLACDFHFVSQDFEKHQCAPNLRNRWPKFKCSLKASRKLTVQPDLFVTSASWYTSQISRKWKRQLKVLPAWRCKNMQQAWAHLDISFSFSRDQPCRFVNLYSSFKLLTMKSFSLRIHQVVHPLSNQQPPVTGLVWPPCKHILKSNLKN